MRRCIKGKILIGLLLLFCFVFLAACGGKSNEAELNRPAQTEAQRDTKDEKGHQSGSSGVKALEDVNRIPSDGVITKEQFATVAGENREIKFIGETEDGISYTWTYNASQIQNPEDQNLKITFDSEDLDDIKKEANNANDALKMTMHGKGLICPPTLTVEIPEAWQSDTGMLLKEQNSKLAKMSDVTIKSEPAADNSTEASDKSTHTTEAGSGAGTNGTNDAGSSSEASTGQTADTSEAKAGQTTDSKSLTEPAEGATTLIMTVLSLEGDSYIVGGITDVDKLAAINQQAQAVASANANPDSSGNTASSDTGNTASSGSDYTSTPNSGNAGNSGSQPAADVPADISNSGSGDTGSGGSDSGSGSGSGGSGDIANNDTGNGGNGSSDSSGSGSSGGDSGSTCTLSISCSTILNNKKNLTKGKEEFVPSDGWILKPTTVSFSSGESVHDVLQRVCKEKGIHMESAYTPAYDSAYVEGINQLYEFDCGELSGWMYNVNGWFPNYGCSKYIVSNGDTINWVYTCDLGKDVGDNSMY